MFLGGLPVLEDKRVQLEGRLGYELQVDTKG